MRTPVNVSRTALIALSVLVVACSAGGTTSITPSAPATRIEVNLTDALQMEPATMTVPAGVPVTFVVTNVGAIDHEFYLGDEKAQADHEQEMLSMGGMMHDEAEGIALDPGETKELTYTFAQPGAILAGCHVAGHYAGGMKASIAVAAQ